LRALIVYISYSGNTEEVAELIGSELKRNGARVDYYELEVSPPRDVSAYDYVFLGTFTWDYGKVPHEVKDFILDVGYKPSNMAIFGTGDTQFGGEEQYCQAVDKLVKFYHSPWPGLKIEQSPRGSQEKRVKKWLEGVVNYVTSYA